MTSKVNVKKIVSDFMSETKPYEEAKSLLDGFDTNRQSILATFGKRLSNATPDDVSAVAGEIVNQCNALGEGHKRYIGKGSMKSAKSDFAAYLNVGRFDKEADVLAATETAAKKVKANKWERRRDHIYKAMARKIATNEKPLTVSQAVDEYLETCTEKEQAKATRAQPFNDLHEFQQAASLAKKTLEREIKKRKISEVDQKHFRPILDALNDFLTPETAASFEPVPAAPGSEENTAAADLASVVSAVNVNDLDPNSPFGKAVMAKFFSK